MSDLSSVHEENNEETVEESKETLVETVDSVEKRELEEDENTKKPPAKKSKKKGNTAKSKDSVASKILDLATSASGDASTVTKKRGPGRPRKHEKIQEPAKKPETIAEEDKMDVDEAPDEAKEEQATFSKITEKAVYSGVMAGSAAVGDKYREEQESDDDDVTNYDSRSEGNDGNDGNKYVAVDWDQQEDEYDDDDAGKVAEEENKEHVSVIDESEDEEEIKKSEEPTQPVVERVVNNRQKVVNTATTFEGEIAQMMKEMISDFCNGSSIATAATAFTSMVKSKVNILSLVSAALFPKKVMVEKTFDKILVSAGFSLRGSQTYNHTLARIAGNMLLEANKFEHTKNLRNKIGGKSLLTANPEKLKTDVAKIFKENKSRFSEAEIRANIHNFRIRNFNEMFKNEPAKKQKTAKK